MKVISYVIFSIGVGVLGCGVIFVLYSSITKGYWWYLGFCLFVFLFMYSANYLNKNVWSKK